MLSQEILSIQDKLKKQLKQQILLNASVFIGGILLFFVFFSDALLLLNNIGTFFNSNILSHWKVLIPSLVDVGIIIFCGYNLVKLYKNYHSFFIDIREDMSEDQIVKNIHDFLNKSNPNITDIIFTLSLVGVFYVMWISLWYFCVEKSSIIDQITLSLGFVNLVGLLPWAVIILFMMPVKHMLSHYKKALLSLPQDIINLSMEEILLIKKQDKENNACNELSETLIIWGILFAIVLYFSCLKHEHALMFKELYPYNDDYVLFQKVNFKDDEHNLLLSGFKIKEEEDVLSFFINQNNLLTLACQVPSTDYPNRKKGLLTLSSKISFDKKDSKDLMTISYLKWIDNTKPLISKQQTFYITPELKVNIEKKQQIIQQYCN